MSRSVFLLGCLLLSACGDDSPPASPDSGPSDAGERDAGAPERDTTPPAVTSTRPANGADLVARVAEVEIRFDEPVALASGVIAATSDGEEIALAERTLDPEGDVVRVGPATEWPGGARIDVTVSGFADPSGNVQEGEHTFVFHTNDDGSPSVVESTPAEGAMDVDVALDTIAIRFDEPMNAVLGTITLAGGPGAIGERAWSSETEVRASVSGLGPGVAYRVVLEGFEDRSGNVFDPAPVLGDGAVDFTTAADETPPTVVDSSPTHEQLDVNITSTRTISVTFSEPMNRAARTAVLTDGSTIAMLTGNFDPSATSVTFDVTGRLGVDATHRLDLSGFEDEAGNALDGAVGLDDGDLVFTTSAADAELPFVVFATPSEGAVDVATHSPAIEILFSEAMSAAASVDLVAPGQTRTLTGSFNAAGTRFTAPLAAGLSPSTAYTIDLRGFTDASSNPIDAAHPYLVDGVLDFTTGAPTGENCADPLTAAEAETIGASFRWSLDAGAFTVADGQPSCSESTGARDGVIEYVKTSADVSGGGSALRIRAQSPDSLNGVQIEVYRDVCDPDDVGGGAAAREVCINARQSWTQYLDVPAGTYYVWISNEGGSTGFIGADVVIDEVPSVPDGESCGAPFSTSSSIYESPGAGEHVWTIPGSSLESVDYGTATRGEGSIPCATRMGPDGVVRVPKARSTSILDVEVDPFPAETGTGIFDRAGSIVEVRNTCDPTGAGSQSLACPGRITSPERFQVTGAAGDYFLWVAANNSEVPNVQTTLRVREIDPAPGETCQSAIAITPGTSNAVTPSSAEAYFAPSCVAPGAGITWYRYTTTRELNVIRLTGSAPVAVLDASTGAEVGCVDDGSVIGVPRRATSGTDVCIAVPSGGAVSAISVAELDWRGVGGTATDLGITRPLGTSGTEVSITADTFLQITPTQIYLGVNTTSTTTAGLVAAPRTGGTRAELLLVDRLMIGRGAAVDGEALWSAEETAVASRLFRLVDTLGTLGPTAWDSGSAYATQIVGTMGRIAGGDLVLATDGSTTAPTTFYTRAVASAGPVTRLGTNSALRDAVAIAGDDEWFFVAGVTNAGPSIYRVSRSALTATPELLAQPDLVTVNSTNGAVALDASRDILYFRSGAEIEAIFDVSSPSPVYAGAVIALGRSGDYGLAIDQTVPSLYVFETETVSTGAFAEVR